MDLNTPANRKARAIVLITGRPPSSFMALPPSPLPASKMIDNKVNNQAANGETPKLHLLSPNLKTVRQNFSPSITNAADACPVARHFPPSCASLQPLSVRAFPLHCGSQATNHVSYVGHDEINVSHPASRRPRSFCHLLLARCLLCWRPLARTDTILSLASVVPALPTHQYTPTIAGLRWSSVNISRTYLDFDSETSTTSRIESSSPFARGNILLSLPSSWRTQPGCLTGLFTPRMQLAYSCLRNRM